MKLLQIWDWRGMFKGEKQDEQFIKAFLKVKERTVWIVDSVNSALRMDSGEV